MSPTSELSDIVLAPTSWYKEGNIFEDEVKRAAKEYQIPIVMSNRGKGFYDGDKLKTYEESLAGHYNVGESVRGRAVIGFPAREPIVDEHNIVRTIEL